MDLEATPSSLTLLPGDAIASASDAFGSMYVILFLAGLYSAYRDRINRVSVRKEISGN